METRDVSENSRGKTTKKSLLHQRKETTTKLGRINFFRNQKINQWLAVIWGALIQEKQPNLGKKRALNGVLIFPIFHSLSPQ